LLPSKYDPAINRKPELKLWQIPLAMLYAGAVVAVLWIAGSLIVVISIAVVLLIGLPIHCLTAFDKSRANLSRS
jgi:hypothetical protein